MDFQFWPAMLVGLIAGAIAGSRPLFDTGD